MTQTRVIRIENPPMLLADYLALQAGDVVTMADGTKRSVIGRSGNRLDLGPAGPLIHEMTVMVQG